MNKKNLLIIFLLMTTAIFLFMFINSLNGSKVTVESHMETLLNLEANDFSVSIALAFCNESEIQTILINNCKDMEQPEIFKNTEKTITKIAQTKYVADVSIPLASYYIDYKTGNGALVRQTIMVTKNNENGQWICEVLDYQQI